MRWVIDPLDGTTNYLYGYPAFAASVAVEIDGRLQIGAVYDSSAGRCYKAVSGFGAFCDDRPIHVREQSDIERSLVATGFSYDAEQRERQGSVVAMILGRVSDIRRGGAAALDLCHIAAGHLDAVLGARRRPVGLCRGQRHRPRGRCRGRVPAGGPWAWPCRRSGEQLANAVVPKPSAGGGSIGLAIRRPDRSRVFARRSARSSDGSSA